MATKSEAADQPTVDAGMAALSEGFCPDCLRPLTDPAGNGGAYCGNCDAWHWIAADGWTTR
jgi:hypothetical protein